MKMILLIVWGAVIWDFLIGDPYWIYHPIVAIGKLISRLEKLIRPMFPKTKVGERIAGGILVFFVLFFSFGVPFLVLFLCYRFCPWLGVVLELFWCGQILATNSLKKESMKVHAELEKGSLEGGRKAVSMIVGRDTQELTEEGVIKATVETIAENASDGAVAPLFYMMIGGAPLGFLYKGINTMDSMIGYKNDKYQYFGTIAAKLDDVANFIPARLTGLCMIVASALLKYDGKQAWKIFKRDRKKHASPNAAQTESVMAGALHIRLAGDAWYFGKLHKKHFLGDPLREIEVEDIKRANQILYVTVAIAAVLLGGIRAMVICFI